MDGRENESGAYKASIMTEERRKLLLSILTYFTIIALVAFVLFHQTIVKQTRTTEALSPQQTRSICRVSRAMVRRLGNTIGENRIMAAAGGAAGSRRGWHKLEMRLHS